MPDYGEKGSVFLYIYICSSCQLRSFCLLFSCPTCIIHESGNRLVKGCSYWHAKPKACNAKLGKWASESCRPRLLGAVVILGCALRNTPMAPRALIRAAAAPAQKRAHSVRSCVVYAAMGICKSLTLVEWHWTYAHLQSRFMMLLVFSYA